jgi:hypothetical protein
MRRTVLTITVLLGAGLLTSLAMAWGLAAWRTVDPNVPRRDGVFERWGRAWHAVQVDQFGASLVFWGDLAVDGPEVPTAQLVETTRVEAMTLLGQTRYPFEIDNRVPRWGTFVASEPPPEPWTMGSDTAFGWPARCLWHQVLTSYDAATGSTVADELVGGVLLRGRPSGVVTGFVALPLRPIGAGLAINAVFYALVLAGLIYGPGRVRRARRRRGGRCIECGYELRGLTEPGCPECGAGRVVGYETKNT